VDSLEIFRQRANAGRVARFGGYADLLRAYVPNVSLREFVERTTNHILDPWQIDLCARLETLADLKGQRWLIHAPPQVGKSVILSQRFPAWLLTKNPTRRIKLACYNITQATRHGRIVRDLMQDAEFAKMFPDPSLRLPKIASAEEWSTAARLKTRDSQPSFKALGLQTGFVGQGASDLLIDDPYASPQDAYSQAVNGSTHAFWTDTSKPRLNDDTNVVVMFHRYTENDLAGFLMDTEPGKWQLIRYAAIADGDYIHHATGLHYPDPLGRDEGVFLSTRFSANWYAEKQENAAVWLSQFQGRPTAKEGSIFKVDRLLPVDAVPVNARQCRAWDLGASLKGDFTAGVKVARDADGLFYVVDVARGQWLPDERNRTIKQAAEVDGRAVKVRLPQDPGQAGVDQAQTLTRLLAGFSVKAERVTGDKVTRADGAAAQVNAGNVRIVRGAWNSAFIEELRGFPLGKNDDMTDAFADAFNELALTGQSEQGKMLR
jgi:predicted phage terminase large subunit-like protein